MLKWFSFFCFFFLYKRVELLANSHVYIVHIKNVKKLINLQVTPNAQFLMHDMQPDHLKALPLSTPHLLLTQFLKKKYKKN